VNAINGEFTEQDRDLAVPCGGPPIMWVRTYSSVDSDTDGPLGYGWTQNYGAHLEPVDAATLAEATEIAVVQENGSEVHFYGVAGKAYDAPTRVFASLVPMADGTFEFRRDNGETLVFDGLGRLSTLRDANGNDATVEYDAGGHLDTVSDSLGRWIDVTWTGEHVTSVTDHAGRTVSYTYDAQGDLATVTDPGGSVTSYGYDSSHRITSVTSPIGTVLTNTYDTSGRIVSQNEPSRGITTFDYGTDSTTITDPAGLATREVYVDNLVESVTTGVGEAYEATVLFTYDATNRPTTITDPFGGVATFTYDEHGNKLSATNAIGKTLRWRYDPAGRLLEQVNDSYETTVTYSYNTHGNLVKEEWIDGAQVVYTYDSRGFLTGIAGPGSYTETRQFDTHGNITSVMTGGGVLTRYEYDNLSRPIAIKDVRGHVGGIGGTEYPTTFTYDARSNVVTATDPVGGNTTQFYDQYGRLTSYVDALGGTTTIAYDQYGRRESITNPLDQVTTYTYDSTGRLVGIAEPGGAVSTVEYDKRGLVTASIDAAGERTEYVYDKGTRLVSVTDPLGHTETTTYDSLGRVRTTTNAAGGVTTIGYDGESRVKSVTDPAGRKTTYSYDPIGNLLKTVRPDGLSETNTYDVAGRLITAKDAQSRTSALAYDADGNLVSSMDFAGRVTTGTYADGFLTSSTSPTGLVSTFEYDGAGRRTIAHFTMGIADTVRTYSPAGLLTEYEDSGGSTSYTYDALGRVTGVTGATGDVGYHYTAAGDLDTLTYPSGLVVTYAYDLNHRMTGLSAPGVGSIAFDRNDVGAVTEIAFPNGVSTAVSYDAAGRLAGAVTASGSTTLLDLEYAYGLDDLLTSGSVARGGAADGRTFTRDTLGRVGSVSTTGGTSVFEYGATHEVKKDDRMGTLVFGADGAVDSRTATNGDSWVYAHDGQGRRMSTTATVGGVTNVTTYGFDPFNRLTSLTDPGLGLDVDYTYSAGLRIGATDSSGTEEYAWDTLTGVPLLLEDADQAYVYGTGSSPLAQVDRVSGEVVFLHADLIGSTRAVTDSSGSIVGTWDYTAYGEVESSSGDVAATRFLFGGEYRDDSGLYYLRARFLDPGSGLFLTVDPAVFSTSMPYAYTSGDPYQQTDPLGLMPSDTKASGQSVLGGIVTGLKNLATGIAYSVNPMNWDDIYQNIRCGALTDGWVASITMNLNPVYGVVANVDAAIGAAQDGRWGDFASYTTEAVGATALTVLGAKAIVTKYLPRVTSTVKAATGKIPTIKTATDTRTAAKQSVGTQGAGRTAGGAKTIEQINQRLQQHKTEQASAYDSGGLKGSAAQQAQVLRNPRWAPAVRGNVIDQAAKQAVSEDPFFDGTGLEVTPRFVRGPDFTMPGAKKWWDITTSRQWDVHKARYEDFGEGTILDTTG
jgi:RHS repeat-associated protein